MLVFWGYAHFQIETLKNLVTEKIDQLLVTEKIDQPCKDFSQLLWHMFWLVSWSEDEGLIFRLLGTQLRDEK